MSWTQISSNPTSSSHLAQISNFLTGLHTSNLKSNPSIIDLGATSGKIETREHTKGLSLGWGGLENKPHLVKWTIVYSDERKGGCRSCEAPRRHLFFSVKLITLLNTTKLIFLQKIMRNPTHLLLCMATYRGLHVFLVSWVLGGLLPLLMTIP